MEDHVVHVLTQLHQNEPVAKPESLHHLAEDEGEVRTKARITLAMSPRLLDLARPQNTRNRQYLRQDGGHGGGHCGEHVMVEDVVEDMMARWGTLRRW